MNNITLSVVSHGQAHMVDHLFKDISIHSPKLNIILTKNISEPVITKITDLKYLRLIKNIHSKGFGSNHNAAFQHCDSPFFCVANPDIRLPNDPFPELLACMNDPKVGLVAPRIITPNGKLEDNARYFPTPANLAAKMLYRHPGNFPMQGKKTIPVDWVAGMFMLFRKEAFEAIGGFDEKFFLYYEDVDICARLWHAGWKVMLHPEVSVIHAAQRLSRRNLRYTAWHLSSMARYFKKHLGKLPKIQPHHAINLPKNPQPFPTKLPTTD
jgi:GT2 family glycosyltransferase